MKAYSVLRKISILADKDYYYWNQREDFGNLGKSSSYTYNEPWKYSISYQKSSRLLRLIPIGLWYSNLSSRQCILVDYLIAHIQL